MVTVVIPEPAFRQCLDLIETGQTVYILCGRTECEGTNVARILFRRFVQDPTALSPSERVRTVALLGATGQTLPNGLSAVGGSLAIDVEGGQISGTYRGQPILRVMLPGAGMYSLEHLDGGAEEPISEALFERHSRSIGAMGVDTWRRLTGLRCAIVGCGRIGSHVAGILGKLGATRFTLVDPDVVELDLLTESDLFTQDDCGHTKVEALAYRLNHGYPYGSVGDTKTDARHILRAYRSIAGADILVSAVDNDAARLACALLSTTHCLVQLDVAAGIHRNDQGQRQMEGDVHLILPGDRCLLCCGGVCDYDRALRRLVSEAGSTSTGQSEPWWLQRMGSLKTMDQAVAGVAAQLLIDLVASRVQSSVWSRLAWHDDGRFTAERPELAARDTCRGCLCSRMGLGDAGIMWSGFPQPS
jgi:molybdopterin/thiamine biosynthesis adenylyltransferase